MFRLHNIGRVYYDAPDSSGLGGDIFGKQDIFDALKDDGPDDKSEKIELDIDDEDDKTDDKEDKSEEKVDKKTKDKSKKDEKDKDDVETEEDDDLKALEEDLKEDDTEPDDEKLELVTPVRRKEILKKYPKLFEDFPYLERAYYREQQFTEIYPTLAVAKETKEKADVLEKFESDLVNGNTERMLAGLKQNDPQGFNKLVDNYLTTLQKVDEKSYTHVVGNVISHTIYAMVQESQNSNNESLKIAAQLLNQFIFGSSKYVAPSKLTTEQKEDPAAKELETQKQQFLQERYRTVSGELKTKIGNLFKSTIAAHIDPKGSMPPYVRANAERDAYEAINELLVQDSRFKTIVDQLWEKATKANFSQESVQNLRKAFLGRGKSLLPTAIKKARFKALSGMKPTTRTDNSKDDDNHEVEKTEKRRSNNTDPSQSKKSGDKYKGMTTLEALNAD